MKRIQQWVAQWREEDIQTVLFFAFIIFMSLGSGMILGGLLRRIQ